MTKEGVGHPWTNRDDWYEWVKLNNSYNYRAALGWVWSVLNRANEYLEKNAPWDKTKTEKERQDTLRDMVACLGVVALLINHYMPETASKIYKTFVWSKPRFWLGTEDYKTIVSDN